ncbi:hypothetical protein Noda2021_02420 [Candidatus Dependentiae bacterium Noda2021]|nr:hypothetical protein Noda2021_02420 [Candidatus Dependentiae bacterium Noda2021]
MIQLAQFLNSSNTSVNTANRTICFTSSAPLIPLQLIQETVYYLARKSELEVVRMSLSSDSDWLFQLSVTFLGTSRLYWITDLENQKNITHVLFHLDNYQGPHRVVTYVPTEMIEKINLKNIVIVELPAEIDKKLFTSLALVLYGIDGKTALPSDVFRKIEKISSEQACMLLNYIKVLGSSTHELLDSDWLEKIIVPDRSLFLLSQYFFAKDETQFFYQWKKIKYDYSDLFWISFWADQLWRAYYIVLFNKKNLTATIKKMSYRLPFSFVQRQWKNYDCLELSKAHNYLYLAEYNIKNGGTMEIIEAFYGAYFCNNFKD